MCTGRLVVIVGWIQVTLIVIRVVISLLTSVRPQARTVIKLIRLLLTPD